MGVQVAAPIGERLMQSQVHAAELASSGRLRYLFAARGGSGVVGRHRARALAPLFVLLLAALCAAEAQAQAPTQEQEPAPAPAPENPEAYSSETIPYQTEILPSGDAQLDAAL